MTFKEWVQTRPAYFWFRMSGARMAMQGVEFRHVGDDRYEWKGETFTLGMTPDDDWTAFAYLWGYLRWCRKHDQEPGPFEEIEED